MASTVTLGRVLMLVSNLSLAFGSFIADFNETHVLNPRWPPHARFHNGQTMTSSLLFAAAAAFFLFKPSSSRAVEANSLLAAVVIGSFYGISGLTGGLYPGSLPVDPEFGDGFPQLYIFGTQLALNWLGYWLEVQRLGFVNVKVD
ncbi:hypothetical protein DV735_g3691, partial [Chaetothyriales sp. CBS 134920]